MIYLSRALITVNSEGQENLLHRGEGSKYQVYFSRRSEREHSFFEPNQKFEDCFLPFLNRYMYTYSEDVFRLLSDLLQDIFMLLLQKISHFL